MRIAMVGDVFLGDQLARFGFGVRSTAGPDGYERCFERAGAIFQGAEVVFANLESALGLPPPPEQHLRTLLNRGSASGAAALRSAGVDIVSLANNHSFEHHVSGLERTIRHLDEAGVAHVGSLAHPWRAIMVGDLRVAFLSWSLVPDAYWPGTNPQDHYHATDDVEDIVAEVAAVRGEVDRIVLALHWGHEFVRSPSTDQVAIAHKLIDAGVDVIAGHHPHVPQPIEERGGGIVAYSLGNFVFDAWSGEDRHGLVMSVDIDTLAWSALPVELDRATLGPKTLVNDRARRAIDATVRDGQRLTPAEAASAAHAVRRRYRIALLWHAVRHIHRFARKRELLGLALRRSWFLARNRHQERRDPYVVYRGPLK